MTDLPIAFAIIAIDFAGFDAPQFSGFRARIDFYLLSAFDPQLQSFELQIYLLLSFEVQIYLLSYLIVGFVSFDYILVNKSCVKSKYIGNCNKKDNIMFDSVVLLMMY